MTLSTLDRILSKEGQFLPIDAPRPTQGTIGGALASGWLGPRRGAYGRPRDFVIGTTIALTDGTLAHSGGMVTKNVTGYDMSKLYIGSLGTLGALIRINFKTLPRPPAQRIALAPLPERTRDRVIHHIFTLDVEPTAALIVTGFEQEILEAPEAGIERLLLLFEGSQPLIERATRDARSQLGAAGVPGTHLIDRGTSEILQRIVNTYVTPVERRSVTYRSIGERTTLSERYEFLARAAQRAELRLETIADLCNGDIIARVSAPTSDALERTIVPFDETVMTRLERRMLLQAPSFLRPRLDAWGSTTAPIDIMRALKERFDPDAMLAPGRLVGGI
jgi:glycolate oxidase FAD binding subunit